jgi:hypothetical protein
MTLPASGPISMAQIAAELGISASGLSLNAAGVRSLAGQPSGSVSMSNLRGKSNLPPLTISATDVNAIRGTNSTGVVGGTSTATASGGSGGYTYVWSYASGDDRWDKSAVTTSSCAFSLSLAPNVQVYTVFQCRVTDSGGRTASCTFSISLSGYQN